MMVRKYNRLLLERRGKRTLNNEPKSFSTELQLTMTLKSRTLSLVK